MPLSGRRGADVHAGSSRACLGHGHWAGGWVSGCRDHGRLAVSGCAAADCVTPFPPVKGAFGVAARWPPATLDCRSPASFLAAWVHPFVWASASAFKTAPPAGSPKAPPTGPPTHPSRSLPTLLAFAILTGAISPAKTPIASRVRETAAEWGAEVDPRSRTPSWRVPL